MTIYSDSEPWPDARETVIHRKGRQLTTSPTIHHECAVQGLSAASVVGDGGDALLGVGDVGRSLQGSESHNNTMTSHQKFQL